MEKLIEKANILIEALPYIRKFYDKVFVIKFGGHAMVDETLLRSFAEDVILMKYIGLNPVVLHGGGPQIEVLLKKLGKETRYVNGLRVTDDETMDVVEMVLGKITNDLVGTINSLGGKAVGLSGKDGRLIVARKIPAEGTGGKDLGKVGMVDHVNPRVIRTLDRSKFIPVIAPVGAGEGGESYNLNADTAAGALAASLKAEKLILLTDVEGIRDGQGGLISSLRPAQARALIQQGVIAGGMIPKVECCLEALARGVHKTHIIDGRVLHAVLLEIFTDVGVGTEIAPEEAPAGSAKRNGGAAARRNAGAQTPLFK